MDIVFLDREKSQILYPSIPSCDGSIVMLYIHHNIVF